MQGAGRRTGVVPRPPRRHVSRRPARGRRGQGALPANGRLRRCHADTVSAQRLGAGGASRHGICEAAGCGSDAWNPAPPQSFARRDPGSAQARYPQAGAFGANVSTRRVRAPPATPQMRPYRRNPKGWPCPGASLRRGSFVWNDHTALAASRDASRKRPARSRIG